MTSRVAAPRGAGRPSRTGLAAGAAAAIVLHAGAPAADPAWVARREGGRAAAAVEAPNGAALLVRCAPRNGFVEYVLVVPGPIGEEHVIPSRRPERAVEVITAYRNPGGGGLHSTAQGIVAPVVDGRTAVTLTDDLGALPNLVAGEGKAAAFRIAAAGHALDLPFMPPALAGAIAQDCRARWYDRALGAIGTLVAMLRR